MAKVNQYFPQHQAAGGMINYRQPAQQNPGIIGRSLQGVGKALMVTSGILAQQEQQAQIAAERSARLQEDRDRQWATNQTTKFKTSLSENFFRAQQTMPPGSLYEDGEAFSDKTRKMGDMAFESFAEEAPSQQAKEFFQGMSSQYKDSTYLKSLEIEAGENARYALQTNVEGASLDINFLMKNPEQLADTWATRKTTILDSENISPLNKASILEKIGPMYAIAPIQIDMNQAKTGAYPAKQIVDDIDNGYYERKAKALGLSIEPKELLQMRDKALSLQKVDNTLASYQQQKIIDDALTDALLTGERPDMSFLDGMETLNAGEIQKYKDQLNVNSAVGQYRKQLVLDPMKFIRETMPKLAQPGDGSSDRAKVLSALETEAKRFVELLNKSPGDAANQWFQSISQSANGDVERTMVTAINAIGDQPVSASEGNTAQLKLAYQRNQGVPENKLEILGETAAKNVVGQLINSSDIVQMGNYASVAQELQKMKSEYGEHYPKAFNELVKAGLPIEYGVLEFAQGSIYTNKMIAAFQQPIEKLKQTMLDKGQTSDALRNVRSNIYGELSDFYKAMNFGAPNGERLAFQESLTDSIFKMTLNEAATSDKDPADIYEGIIKNLVDDRYNVADTLIIPKVDVIGQPLDHKTIIKNLNKYSNNIPENKLSPQFMKGSLPPNMAKSEMAELVRNEGYWVSTSDNKGAYLVIDVGPYMAQPILDDTGKRIERNFSNMNSPTYVGPEKVKSNGLFSLPRTR